MWMKKTKVQAAFAEILQSRPIEEDFEEMGEDDPICIVAVDSELKGHIVEVLNYKTASPITLDSVEEYMDDPWDDWLGLEPGVYKLELTIDGYVDYWGECESWLKVKSAEKYKLVLEKDGGKKENKI